MTRVVAGLLALFGAALFAVWGPAAPASACSCAGGSTQQFFARADVVFTGTLVSREVSHPAAPTMSSADPALHVFAVGAVFKGGAAEQQGVVSAESGASCGLELSGDGPFAVFATRDASLPEGRYAATLCGGTGELTPAVEAELRELAGPADPPSGPLPGGAGVERPAARLWSAGGVAAVLVAAAGGVLGWRSRRARGLSGK